MELEELTVEKDFREPTQGEVSHENKDFYQPHKIVIYVGPIFDYVTAHIILPSGEKFIPKLEDKKYGKVEMSFTPQTTGLHELHVSYNHREIRGSPFFFHADPIHCKYVRAFGPGLSHGIVGIPSVFDIVTRRAGEGNLSIAIEGPVKSTFESKDNDDGTVTVKYIPTEPGEYHIVIKFNGNEIFGSPFTAKITDPEDILQLQHNLKEVSLNVLEADIQNLKASVEGPDGNIKPCLLVHLPNGHIGVQFPECEEGDYIVSVYRNGKHIDHSPFNITIGQMELGSAKKVRVYGQGIQEGITHQKNEFTIDTRDTGYGDLEINIEGPRVSQVDTEINDNEDGTCVVSYTPTRPGIYVINVKFAGDHVPGNPFTVEITEEGNNLKQIPNSISRREENSADVVFQ